MRKIIKRYHPPGTPPGTLIHLPADTVPPRIHLIDYSETAFTEREIESAADCLTYTQQPTTTWIHVQGTTSSAMLEEFGHLFNLHPLALEDVQNLGQRPKFEIYDDRYFIVAAIPVIEDRQIQIIQINLFFGDNFVISFVHGDHDPFEAIRRRLRALSGHLRNFQADYLMYSILDLIVDEGFPVLEKLAEHIEVLEEEILTSPSEDSIAELHEIKRSLLVLRRILWPQREVINALLRDETTLIQDHTRLYLRDCYDHSIQVMELMENYRDMTSSLLDVYLSSISNRMNDVMRVLTVIATIFIPLTFIAGVYGMNFGNNSHSPWAMPELNWYYGYPLALLLMLVVAVVMILYFRRKKWF